MATPATPLPPLVTINQQSPGAIQARVQQILAAAKGLDSSQAFVLTGNSLQTLQQEIYALHANEKKLANAINSSSSSSTTIVTTGPAQIAL